VGPPQKEITVSRPFGRHLTDLEAIRQACCSSLGWTRELAVPTDYTPDLIDAATIIHEKIYRPGHAYQKCGVMLTDLVPASSTRHDLFDHRDLQKQSRLMKAMDAINSNDGARTIHFGNLSGAKPQWAMRAAFRSPALYHAMGRDSSC